MDGMYMQTALWVGAGALLLIFMSRRRRRKAGQ